MKSQWHLQKLPGRYYPHPRLYQSLLCKQENTRRLLYRSKCKFLRRYSSRRNDCSHQNRIPGHHRLCRHQCKESMW
jgi:hypothetical protein